MKQTNYVAEVMSTMSRTMRNALVDFAQGQDLHGREHNSLATRGLIDDERYELTPLGVAVLETIHFQEKKPCSGEPSSLEG